MKTVITTHPQPGDTKFDIPTMPPRAAQIIADRFFQNAQLSPESDSSGHYFSVRTHAGFVGLVGLVDGLAAMLIKRPDGGRDLHTNLSV